MNLESAHTPSWANGEHTAINLWVKFEEFEAELPFTACLEDCEHYCRSIFLRARMGEFGEVAE